MPTTLMQDMNFMSKMAIADSINLTMRALVFKGCREKGPSCNGTNQPAKQSLSLKKLERCCVFVCVCVHVRSV